MGQNTTIEKPSKPHPDFPLFPHATKRWAKKVRGGMHYFGPWNDPDAALAKWLEQKDELLAGRTPRAKGDGGLQLKDLANRFISAQDDRVASDDLSPITRNQYFEAMGRVVSHFGRTRLVSDITPEDWGRLRAELAKRLGPVALGVEIQRIRTAFNWAYEAGVIDTPMRFGLDFKKPKRNVLRAERQGKPQRFLTREQILALIAAAEKGGAGRLPSPELKAAILLGINCGWGNGDIAGLNLNHLDLTRGIADYPRPKTHIERRCILWPETVQALQAVLERRKKLLFPAKPEKGQTAPPSEVAEADLNAVFLTKFRQRYVIPGKVDSIGLAFGRLLRHLEMKQEGVNFYALRHVFETIAEETKDTPAIHRIMGHTDETISNNYREWDRGLRENARLQAVADYMHVWLFGEPMAGAKATQRKLKTIKAVAAKA